MTEKGAVTPRRQDREHSEDSDLLREFADLGSQEAFAELVRRRIDLVYAVALRQTGGDRHRAEDATQAVFTDLARKAGALAGRPVLIGWLHRSARFAAAGLVRGEQRRQAREKEAHTMETLLSDPAHDAAWQQVRPVLDEALSEIDERDRDAILLRFFDGRPFVDIGARLRLTENAARMRVERALDQLNAALAKRGITSTAAALGAALGHPLVTATPAGLANTVTGAALAQAATGASGWLATVAGMSTLQVGVAAGLAVAGTAGFFWQRHANAALRSEIAALNQQQPAITALRAENERFAATVAEVELLRRDDAEFKRLSQEIADAQKAAQEKALLARQMETRQAKERNIRAEIDRMNREGNVLVGEFKALGAQSKDPARTASERESAATAAKFKLTEIQAKQREIQTFIAAARAANPDLDLGNLGGRYHTGPPPEADAAERQARRAAADAIIADSAQAPERVSLRLPESDYRTAVSALEQISGRKIIRDPSLSSVTGTLTVQTDRSTREEAFATLQNALRERFNIMIETNTDGALVAKLGPPK